MADEQETEQEEPSIEEILDSIRQIISDDDEEGEDGAAQEAAPEPDPIAEPEPAPEPESAPEPEPEVAQEAAPEPEPEAAPEPEPEATPEPEPEPAEPAEEDVLELTEKIEDDSPIEVDMQDAEPEPAPAPEPEPEAPAPPTPEPLPPVSDEALFTQRAESAALGAMESIAKKASIERGGNVTVEDIVREEIRPMLREWLDANLPDMIERLVQKELERVSNRLLED